jgi:hypothetical protein
MRAFSVVERRNIGFGRYNDGILDLLIGSLVGLHQLQSSPEE